MRKIFNIIGILGICLFSFYYTNKVALYVRSKNPLMNEIESNKDSLYVDAIDSEIIDSIYVIPGLNGKSINVNKSFNNMKDNVYNEELLVYDSIIPSISINDNKNKIIIRGNSKKKSVSLLFREDNVLIDKIKYKYNIDVLISKENYISNVELVNISNNSYVYKRIDDYLSKNKINSNLCYVINNINKLCNDKYLFKESLVISHSNISSVRNKIRSGEIILIENSVNISELDIIIKQIEYQGFKIVYLSNLISEIN